MSSNYDDLGVRVREAVLDRGYAIVEDVLDEAQCRQAREKCYGLRQRIAADVGAETLERAASAGYDELRLPYAYDRYFLEYLELAPLHACLDALLSPTCILRFMHAHIRAPQSEADSLFLDNDFHMNIRRVMGGYIGAIEVAFAVDRLDPSVGTLLVAPGTQQRDAAPKRAELEASSVALEIREGSMLVFDPTLWHRQERNRSTEDRISINLSFCRAFMKPHFDSVRALGEDDVRAMPPRTRQYLGLYARTPSSLAEFFLPASERFYRGDQD